ncbi:TPR and ankyrin repeat-containing 1-like isoform A [Micractinium conductrix]|uniref:TPR and ankyrin repeat-containing 1-like isoform A n=1 Tax=Micractinium conductrix TaxID=554055 RepID=A0A2P6VC02_9CHLO|nr:TPR and ankyrin repeat-containing 1-like isoform A [Micractinium conductrix]|eukprot:PSC71609.1 TPR and ankyrin repeat-containing 1-like isoform A [Micractinium conductrix]
MEPQGAESAPEPVPQDAGIPSAAQLGLEKCDPQSSEQIPAEQGAAAASQASEAQQHDADGQSQAAMNGQAADGRCSGSDVSGGAANTAAAPPEAAALSLQPQPIEEVESDNEGSDAVTVDSAERTPEAQPPQSEAADSHDGGTARAAAAAAAAAGDSAEAASGSGQGPQAHPVGLSAAQQELGATLEKALAAGGGELDERDLKALLALGKREGDAGAAGGAAVGGNMFGSLLGGLRSAAAAAGSAAAGAGSLKEKLQEALSKHVRVGARSSLGGRERERLNRTGGTAQKQKQQSTRSVKREVKRQEEKASKKHERERARRAEEQATAEDLKLASKANVDKFAQALQGFAAACTRGDRAAVHLQISDLFSDASKVILAVKGMPQVPGLPWKPRARPPSEALLDFFDACFALSIRATGRIELVNEIERLAKERGEQADFIHLVSSAAAEGDAWRSSLGAALDPEAFKAKRALVHEWIEKGHTDVLRKALSLAPLCIRAPEEPPLVTALRQGHPAELVSLLVDPVVRRRTHKDPLKAGVDEASPTDGATAIGVAIQVNRADVLQEVLKHSARWQMSMGGKAWTPLCYALAQGRAAMVPLLLAHAKRAKPEAADLAEYVNEVCDGATALHRAVAAAAPAMVRLLLESGADPSVRTREGGAATSALHLAAQSEESRPLLDLQLSYLPAEQRAAVLNSLVDARGNSLLHVAVSRHDVGMAQTLLEMGARPTSQSEGRSPLLRLLHWLEAEGPGGGAAAAVVPAGEPEQGSGGEALQEQLRQVEAAFLQHWALADTAKVLHPAQRPADAAIVGAWVLRQRGRTLDPLLGSPGERRQLAQAGVDDRNVPLLELLLEQPGFSAEGLYLHRLVDRSRGTLLGLLRRLLAAGASVNEREPAAQAPLLHKAAEENDLPCLELLLEAGADVEATDAQRNTALHAVAGQREKAGVVYTAVVARLCELAPQLVTRRNREFFLPSDRAPAGSAVEAQLEALTRNQLDAAKFAEEAERWERAAKDLTLLGPPTEEPDRKRRRVDAMLSKKLALTVQNIVRQERLGLGLGGAGAGPALPATPLDSSMPADRRAGAPDAPTTPDAAAIYRQRPRRRNWADLADEMPAVVRLPVWPESLEAAAAAARADPAAAVAQILQQAAPEGGTAVSSLSELPWEIDLHRDAWAEWMGMQARHRRAVLTLLLRAAAGGVAADRSTFQRVTSGGDGELGEVYLARLPKGACLVMEVAPEMDVRRSVPAATSGTGERTLLYQDILRVWLVTLDEGRVRDALDTLAASYRKGQSARHQLLLQPQPQRRGPAGAAAGAAGEHLPGDYACKVVTRAEAVQAAAAAAKTGGGAAALRRHFPPASTEADSYTVLKFHPLDDAMLHAVMTNEGQTEVDFKFRLSPEETEIVERIPQPPQSLILLGRSGTGKTTCAVFRMFDRWRRAFEAGDTLHQVFVTVSATLKEQVAKAFVRLRNGLPAVTPDRAAAYAAAAAQPHHSFRGLPEEAWPLFLSAKQYMHMLDGTLRTPFFKRRADGGFYYESEARDDEDGMSQLVDLAGASGTPAAGNGAQGDGSAEEGARIQVTFSYFQSSMFRRLVNTLPPEERRKVDFTAGLAWQEIVSYLKGTKQAVEGGGRLTEEEYLGDVGRKQAPNFGPESRRLIFRVATAYEAMKRTALVEGHVSHFLYDQADFVAHMHRQLKQGGFLGEPVHELYCDEVQDFTQAELLLGLRVVADPNGMFLCGDTCQTIARGIGFRFTDVKQLFWEAQREAAAERERRGAGGVGGVQMPAVIPLETNYRTHSGVLDVAASVVRTKNFEAAATCYRKAGNVSRAAACQAQAMLQEAAQADEDAAAAGTTADVQRALRFDAGYTLLATAVNASPQEADPGERREWLLLAAAALKAAGEEAAATEIARTLGPAPSRAAGGLRA